MTTIHPDNRTCTKCQRTYPVDMFPVYRAKGYEGRRHQCRGCTRASRTRWELELTGERAARYYARKRVTDAKSKQRERNQRYRQRLMYMRNAITALLETGLTRKEIARRAGLGERTVRRILNGDGGRVRFEQPTEEKVMDLYWNVRGAA